MEYIKPALIQIMARDRTGKKPLPEVKLAQLTNTHMRHDE